MQMVSSVFTGLHFVSWFQRVFVVSRYNWKNTTCSGGWVSLWCHLDSSAIRMTQWVMVNVIKQWNSEAVLFPPLVNTWKWLDIDISVKLLSAALACFHFLMLSYFGRDPNWFPDHAKHIIWGVLNSDSDSFRRLYTTFSSNLIISTWGPGDNTNRSDNLLELQVLQSLAQHVDAYHWAMSEVSVSPSKR